MEKFRYEIDPHNRLVESKEGVPGFRRVLEGRFKTLTNNELTYHVKSPLPYASKKAYQIKLKDRGQVTILAGSGWNW